MCKLFAKAKYNAILILAGELAALTWDSGFPEEIPTDLENRFYVMLKIILLTLDHSNDLKIDDFKNYVQKFTKKI
ncbi:hypothetical protein [Mycoplasmopsis columbinasalis]|nr:hypothetical protein [Mycoplasmopsis columbinasalis]